MSYLTERFAASFRGVPFLVDSHATVFGRKTAVYRLPFDSSGVAHLDMGRAPREFDIKAILLETPSGNLRQQRDALVTALETEGAGLLVHPVFGRVNVVVCNKVRLVEDTANGGKIEVSFEAIEARDPVVQTAFPSPKADAIKKAKLLRTVAGTSLANGFLSPVPDFVTLSNLRTLDAVLTDIRRVNSLVSAALGAPLHLAGQLNSIANEAATLIGTPQALYDAIDATLATIHQAVITIGVATGRVRRGGLATQDSTIVASAAIGLTAEEPTGTTPTREAEKENHARLLISFRASALANAAQAAADATYQSADDARNVLQTLTDALTELSENAIAGYEPDADVFDAIRELIAAITTLLSGVAGTLSDLTTHTPAAAVPAIVIAYNLYGDATRVDEILARNPVIVHPLFAPGRTELEVLAP